MPMSSDQRRKFAAKILEAEFFGAFVTAIETRRDEQGLTQADLAKRTGREKTGMSKLLSGPRNWMLSTASDLAEALSVRFEFVLVDKLDPTRRFTSTGVQYDFSVTSQMGEAIQNHWITNAQTITGIVWNPTINGESLSLRWETKANNFLTDASRAITFAPAPTPLIQSVDVAQKSENQILTVA